MKDIEVPIMSFVLPTKNEGERLPRCLESLRAQTDNRFEVIVVDDSTDSTVRLLDELRADSHFVVLRSMFPGVGRATGEGIQRSSGRLITLLDAENRLTANCVETIANIAEGGYAWITGSELNVLSCSSLSCRIGFEYLRFLFNSDPPVGKHHFFSREHFLRVGWDADRYPDSGGDIDFLERFDQFSKCNRLSRFEVRDCLITSERYSDDISLLGLYRRNRWYARKTSDAPLIRLVKILGSFYILGSVPLGVVVGLWSMEITALILIPLVAFCAVLFGRMRRIFRKETLFLPLVFAVKAAGYLSGQFDAFEQFVLRKGILQETGHV